MAKEIKQIETRNKKQFFKSVVIFVTFKSETKVMFDYLGETRPFLKGFKNCPLDKGC